MREIANLIWDLEAKQRQLDSLINATPTSEKRNELCDANIHLLAVMDNLRKALSL